MLATRPSDVTYKVLPVVTTHAGQPDRESRLGSLHRRDHVTPSKDSGVITWFDLSASFSISGGTATEAEKIPARAYREDICWDPEGWREAA